MFHGSQEAFGASTTATFATIHQRLLSLIYYIVGFTGVTGMR